MFHRHYLIHKRPYVDPQYAEPNAEALIWIDRTTDPVISQIATVDGRILLRVDYTTDGNFWRKLECVMLAMETTPRSNWFAPFFVAQPELFNGKFVSSDSIRIGYVASLEFSGTGAMRTHHLFDLVGDHPKLIESISAGRVRSIDFTTEKEYQHALEIFDREAAILRGEKSVATRESRPEGDQNAKPKY